MEVQWPEPGKYVVAVSGGVDSVVLLHLLSSRPGLRLTVAHLDHGIRPESAGDERFVRQLAAKMKLPFEAERVELGPAASEAAARRVRYDFLERVSTAAKADAIVTAHHLDDVLETAVINLVRGGGRKGLTALNSRPGLARPLLRVTKREILDYAAGQSLEWREDDTNQDGRYLRNHIRHHLMPKLTNEQKLRLSQVIERQVGVNDEMDTLLVKLMSNRYENMLDRSHIINLPYDISAELMAAWLRQNGLRDFDRPAINRLVVAAKTARPGKRLDVLRGRQIAVGKDSLSLL